MVEWSVVISSVIGGVIGGGLVQLIIYRATRASDKLQIPKEVIRKSGWEEISNELIDLPPEAIKPKRRRPTADENAIRAERQKVSHET